MKTKKYKELIKQYLYKNILLSVVFIVFSVCGCAKNESKSMFENTVQPFKLETLNGDSVNFADLKEKLIVIHIATTWCPFCNAEAPNLEKLWQNYKSRNVQVLLINVKEDKEIVKKWASRYNVTFPVLLDTNGKVSASFAPSHILPELPREEVGIAANILIDTKGKIQFFSLLDTKSFDAKLTALTKKLNELLLSQES